MFSDRRLGLAPASALACGTRDLVPPDLIRENHLQRRTRTCIQKQPGVGRERQRSLSTCRRFRAWGLLPGFSFSNREQCVHGWRIVLQI